MNTLSQKKFLQTFPAVMIPNLPPQLQSIQTVSWSWLVKFHFGEPRLHYELSPAKRRNGWEIGFHCEAKDKHLNKILLLGFRRHLLEIKHILGDSIEAEMWDKGWTKIYEVYPAAPLTTSYQAKIGQRFAQFITFLHPLFIEFRGNIAQVYR